MTQRSILRFFAVLLTLAGCDADPGTDAGPPDTDAGGGTDAGSDAGPPREVTCVDESISQLMFFDVASPAAITDESAPGPMYAVHHIDATGGGVTPTQSYVYARFGEGGTLTKVDLDDETSLTSSDWDIAFRRFVIRLNSGVSGPSSVTAARTAPGTDFETLTAVPDGLSYREEAYFTDTCEYVPDGSGLGSPQTALSSFWSYAGCVAMTGNVYVLQLASGRHVKLEVTSYYSPDVQTMCNDTGMAGMPSGAGNLRIRWAFLD